LVDYGLVLCFFLSRRHRLTCRTIYDPSQELRLGAPLDIEVDFALIGAGSYLSETKGLPFEISGSVVPSGVPLSVSAEHSDDCHEYFFFAALGAKYNTMPGMISRPPQSRPDGTFKGFAQFSGDGFFGYALLISCRFGRRVQ